MIYYMYKRGLVPIPSPPHIFHQVQSKQIIACAMVLEFPFGVSPRPLNRVGVESGHWVHKILGEVDCAMDISTPIKGVICLPHVSVDSRTTSDIL